MPSRFRTRFALALPVLLLAVVPAARAQLSSLDPGTLIKGLEEAKMSDLLIHLAETEKFPDPTVGQQIVIAQRKIQFGDDKLPLAERYQSLEEAMRLSRDMIKGSRDHVERPIWQTDLAEMILLYHLPVVHDGATLFFEFGVMTGKQRDAVHRGIVEALEVTEDANLRLFQLQGELPRRPDFKEKFENPGTFDRLINKYWKLRTQYYRSQASLLVAMLDNSHEYYQTLGRNTRVPRQGKTPAEERKRLLSDNILAQADLEALYNDTSQPARLAVASIMGRAALQMGLLPDALKHLTLAKTAPPTDLFNFASQLAMAKLQDRQNNLDECLATINGLKSHPIVTGNLLYRMLVVDLEHLIRLARAEREPADQRVAAIDAAYKLYMDLLADERLGESVEGVRDYIYMRWADNAGKQDLSQVPPIVAMAVGDMSYRAGQVKMIESITKIGQAQQILNEVSALRDQPNADEAQLNQMRAQARQLEAEAAAPAAEALPKLKRSIEINTQLIARKDAGDVIRGTARFTLGMATYFLDVNDTTNIVAAARELTNLASDQPTFPQAERAIEIAESMLRPVHQMTPRPTGVAEQYNATAKVLFEKYGKTKAADNARLYYAFFVLIPQGSHDEAVNILESVPFDHVSYWESKREMLFSMTEAYRTAGGEDREARGQRINRDAQRIISEAAARLPDAGEQAGQVKHAMGAALLALAEVASDRGDVNGAVKHLEGFEQQFAEHADLVRAGQEKRIMVFVAADRISDAADAANVMMRQFPDDAAAVINDLLTSLERDIDSLRARAAAALAQREKQELNDRAVRNAKAAVELARLLRDWALTQGMDKEQLVPYHLIHAKSLRLAGDSKGAIGVLTPLLRDFGDDANILSEAAEAYFVGGDRDSLLTRAAPLYDKIITGMGEPYPAIWWNAWLRRLQIMDKLNEATDDIVPRIKQLRFTDDNLGGQPYKAQFEALERLHTR